MTINAFTLHCKVPAVLHYVAFYGNLGHSNENRFADVLHAQRHGDFLCAHSLGQSSKRKSPCFHDTVRFMSVFLGPGRFYGELVKNCAVSGFLLSESTYRPGERINRHSHSSSYISILLRGSYRETYDLRTRDCSPSTIVFHPAGEVHADHFDSCGGHIFRLELSHFPKGIDYSALTATQAPFELVGGPIASMARRLYTEFKRQDQFSPLIMEGIGLEILGHCARRNLKRQTRQPLWLRRVEEFLKETAIAELTLSRIAEVADVHAVHLARVFRMFHGCTVGEYVRRLRVDHAIREICSSSKGLTQIAAEAGFSDQSHFCRTFKLSTGMTPGRYRNLIEQG
jgi:AraC family transcriptional regulator